jgi:hypothetical protein
MKRQPTVSALANPSRLPVVSACTMCRRAIPAGRWLEMCSRCLTLQLGSVPEESEEPTKPGVEPLLISVVERIARWLRGEA